MRAKLMPSNPTSDGGEVVESRESENSRRYPPAGSVAPPCHNRTSDVTSNRTVSLAPAPKAMELTPNVSATDRDFAPRSAPTRAPRRKHESATVQIGGASC